MNLYLLFFLGGTCGGFLIGYSVANFVSARARAIALDEKLKAHRAAVSSRRPSTETDQP